MLGPGPRTVDMGWGQGQCPVSHVVAGPSRSCACAESLQVSGADTTLLSIGGSGIRTGMLVGRHGEVSSWHRQVSPASPCARDLHRLGPGSVIVAVTRPSLPDDVRQDLMLPFGPIPDEAGRGVILSAG